MNIKYVTGAGADSYIKGKAHVSLTTPAFTFLNKASHEQTLILDQLSVWSSGSEVLVKVSVLGLFALPVWMP